MSLVSEQHPVQYAFTMLQVEKIGINTKFADTTTPAGVYFYPLTMRYCQYLFENDLPSFGDRRYVGIAKIKNFDDSWLKFGLRDSNEQSEMKYQQILNDVGPDILVQSERLANRYFSAIQANTDLRIYKLLQAEAMQSKSNNFSVAFTKLLRSYGYIGMYDAGLGLIAMPEPSQLVCLQSNAYQIIDIIETSEIRNNRKLFGKRETDTMEWLSKLSATEKLTLATSKNARKRYCRYCH